MSKPISTLLTLGPYVLLLSLAFFLWGPSGYDDSYITYWSAKQLADFGFIGNVNGELVEQGSSVLHVVLLAALHQITGINLPNLGIYFSLFFALLCLPLMTQLSRLLALPSVWASAWFLALSASFSCWAVGGLESTLVAFILLAFCLSCFYFFSTGAWRYGLLCSAFALLYLLARPEAYFVLLSAGMALSFFAYYSQDIQLSWKKTGFLLVVISLLFIAIAAVRYQVYGQIFPQPVYAKSEGFSLKKLAYGLAYFIFTLQLSIVIYTALLLVPIVQLLKHKRLALLPAILLAVSLAQVAFIIVSGGDWMNAGRFFVPVIGLLILLSLYALRQFRYRKPALIGLLCIVVLEVSIIPYVFSTGIRVQSFAQFQHRLGNQIQLDEEPWAEKMNIVHLHNFLLAKHGIAIIKALEKDKTPLEILTVQMGLIPYYLSDTFHHAIHFTDMRGLTTQHLTQCKALKAIKQNWLGVFISYQEYFAEMDKKDCDLPEPDIILDHERGSDLIAFLKSRDYKLVYYQDGLIKTDYASRWIKANAFIVVKASLYDRLPPDLRQQSYHFPFSQ